MSGRVCIVTPTYISSNPRVVKEADALWGAGFDVRVVFSQGGIEDIRSYDEALLQGKPWRRSIVRWSSSRKDERRLYHLSRLRHNAAGMMPGVFLSVGRLAEYAEGRVYKELAELAAKERADLYIGHYPSGLAAASRAAGRHGAMLGYDMEDLHSEEHASGGKQARRVETIERRYLGGCSHLTAVSDMVADEIAARYNVKRPVAVYNVFPAAERKNMDGMVKDRKGAILSLYWFSQVVGLDRGIQDAIRAAGLLQGRAEIHLRGGLSEGAKKELMSLARACGAERDVYFHPPVPPAELLSRAAEHDIGLALEQPASLNRRIAVTNKIFLYMLAGLAIAATDIPANRRVIGTCRAAGFLYPPGDYKALAEWLNKLLSDLAFLRSRKEASLRAAGEIWNWEKESLKIVDGVKALLKV